MLMKPRWLACIAFAVACGATHAKTANTESNVTRDSVAVPLAWCPKSFAEAERAQCGTRATSADYLGTCTYPEGTCTCAQLVYSPCGGPVPPPPQPTDVASIRCKPIHRTDGCPDQIPAPGAACASADQVCSYDECGYDPNRTRRCQGGEWQPYSYPPRP
jgi:hypothetical protein